MAQGQSRRRVIIPPQWRALDIILEMERAAISFKQVLIEHQGALIDYFAEAHPYELGKFQRIASVVIDNRAATSPINSDTSRIANLS